MVWPRLGNFVPGPRDPKTNRGLSGVENASAASLAIFPPANANSYIRSSMP